MPVLEVVCRSSFVKRSPVVTVTASAIFQFTWPKAARDFRSDVLHAGGRVERHQQAIERVAQQVAAGRSSHRDDCIALRVANQAPASLAHSRR